MSLESGIKKYHAGAHELRIAMTNPEKKTKVDCENAAVRELFFG
jgi:hypothetical protein